ncbi:hypothetical protein Tco_0920721, partial [Tanacetum coccineum]
KAAKLHENGWPLTMSAYKVSKAALNASILVVLEDPATGEPGTESFPPFSADSLALVLRMGDCPSPTLTAQPESG